MSLRERHQSDIALIRDEFVQWNHERTKSDLPGNLTLAPQKHVSNTMRSDTYKQRGPKIEIGHLNRVLDVDVDRMVAWVEPRVTMEQLVDATLPYQLLPAVVPEFKTITVGGAINGAALESSSHRHSQFNDTCLSYEILLGDGSIVKASPDEHSDLYYGISGAYGTVGIILSAEVQLVPALPWVQLNYLRCSSVDTAVERMRQLIQGDSRPEYLEGIVFNKTCAVVIEGRAVSEADFPKLSLKKTWSPWFFDHVRRQMQKGVASEMIPLRDYLFRHDRAAFWMGAYSLYPKLLFRYILEYFGLCSDIMDRRLMDGFTVDTSCLKSPSFAFRALFGWMMNSGQLYRFMHNRTEQWFADHFAIQDYYIPHANTSIFVEEVFDKYGMAPVWLCPILSTTKPQLLSPHYMKESESSLLFDVGVYAIANKTEGGRDVVQGLDKSCKNLGGRKMLYAYSYTTPENFWKGYAKDDYDALRTKYGASDVFPDITKKVLS